MAKKARSATKARVLKDLTYVANVTAGKLGGEVPMALMELSAAHRKQIQFKPGAIFRLEIAGGELIGMVIETSEPNPLRKDELDKRRRKAKNFATAQVVKNTVTFEQLKFSRSEPFRFPEGVHRARLKIIETPTIKNSKRSVSKTAKTRSDALQIPKKIGKPGESVDAVVELCQNDFSWIQTCVFVQDGKTLIGRVDISPPFEGVNIKGKPYKIGAIVSASVGEHRKGGVATVAPKEFRGWPGSVGRAFLWVAKQAKGGTIMTRHCELKRSARGGKKTKNTKQAENAAMAAWKEVLGIE